MIDKATGRETPKPLPRRFYKQVSLSENLGIRLDGRAVRTRSKAEMLLPSRALAEAVAEEWRAQVDVIDPATMPLTKYANTAIDRAGSQSEAIRQDILSYAANDLVCYRVDAPSELASRQAEMWDPVVAWAEQRTQHRWQITSGLKHVEQPAAALDTLQNLIPTDSFSLVGCHGLTTLSGSALLALMLLEGAISVETAWQAANIEEHWQAEQWGEDAEALARSSGRKAEFQAAARFTSLAVSRG